VTLSHDVRDQLIGGTNDSPGLKKRLAGLLADLGAFLAEATLANWSKEAKKAALATLTRLLRDRLTPAVAGLPLPELVEAAYDEIVEASELNFTENPKGKPYCNSWWCFAAVAGQKEFDYPIFFAEAGHVGYKRTTRHPEGIEQPNDLFHTDDHGNVLIDTDLWETDERALATVDVNIVRVAEGRADPAFLVHLLRHRLVQWQIEQELAGATNQIHIYGDQLARLRLPHFVKDANARLARKIAEAAKQLSDTRAILRLPGDIINEALCAEFGYPLKEHQERSRLHQFSASLSKMAAGFTLRNSNRYHHPDFDLIEAFFAGQEHERVKAFVAIPIRLGSTAEKGDFVEAGAAYYVHPGATKRQEVISLEDCHQVSEEFYKDRSRRCGLQRLDVTINRSGEAVGKVAYYNSDEPAVFSDFTMRLRFNTRINPLFAWLYFRSVMFQAQLFREIKGASLPNILPGQVERLLVVSCDRPRQDSLVKAIMGELKKQADAKQKLYDKINGIQVAIESEVLARMQKS
jgi:hypothetical protein